MSDKLQSLIEKAAGRRPADLLISNARLLNVFTGEIITTNIAICDDRVAGLGDYTASATFDARGAYVAPGFIDAHVHIESSLLTFSEYAKVVSRCGTTSVIADPHEFANIAGIGGIQFLLSSSRGAPVDLFATLSSCVPASKFEFSGVELGAEQLRPLVNHPAVLGLAEVMNYPGVIAADQEILRKIGLIGTGVVDGHAPGVQGRDLCAYRAAGIMSDHECTSAEEAIEKLRLGFHIMIREGSQTRNLRALLPAVNAANADRFMFCTDDKDVRDLLKEGHIDFMIRTAIECGIDPLLAIRMATLNTARYFGLRDHGAIFPGAIANLVVLEDLKSCRVRDVFHHGKHVERDNGSPRVESASPNALNGSVKVKPLSRDDFRYRWAGHDKAPRVHVIHASENRIDTQHIVETAAVYKDELITDTTRDLAKIMVIERHQASGKIGRGLVRGFALRSGAMASSVAHDSHNIIVVGVDDSDMLAAVNRVIELNGGLVVTEIGQVLAEVPLPVAGLVSDKPAEIVAEELQSLMKAARRLGCRMEQPFMAMSFLSLSVIGKLKLTHNGLVDVDRFEIIDLIAG